MHEKVIISVIRIVLMWTTTKYGNRELQNLTGEVSEMLYLCRTKQEGLRNR